MSREKVLKYSNLREPKLSVLLQIIIYIKMWNKIKYYKHEFIVFSLLKSLQTKV